MLWAAFLAFASTSPEPVATERTFPVDVGGAHVTVAIDVAAVSRPVRVPVRVRAAPRFDAHPTNHTPLIVFVCDDARCALRTPVEVPLDDKPVTIEATLFPTGLALMLRHAETESMCCSTTSFGRGTHVVAWTSSGPHTEVHWYNEADTSRGNIGATILVPAGDAMRARPSMLDAFTAVVVPDDEDSGAVVAGDALAQHLDDYVSRGGLVSVPVTWLKSHRFFEASKGTELSLTTPVFATMTPMANAAFSTSVSPFSLSVPDETYFVPYGNGHFIVRPLGATTDEMLAGVAAAYPSIVSWQHYYSYADNAAIRAAGAGLAARPHRGVAFFIAFVCVVAIAWSVRSAKRHGWRRALALSVAIGAGGASALSLFEVATMPRETHVRVVAWMGPTSSWEVGVDAKRPRSTGNVTVNSPIAPVSATVLGADTLPPRQPKNALGVDAAGNPVVNISATVGSASALAVSWERPVLPAHQTLPVELVNGVVRNNLDVELRAVAMARSSAATKNIAPKSARAVADFEATFPPSYDDALLLSPMEARLLHEINAACVARVGRTWPLNAQHHCGAAIAWQPDGTLLGIEIEVQP